MSKIILIILFIVFAETSFASNNKAKLVLTEATTVSILGAIDATTVVKASQELMVMCLKEKKDLYLVLNSPGGSVAAGMNFIDIVNALPCKVHTITIFAASMAYQIVQNLNDRLILQTGILMSHRASIPAPGLSGQIPGELVTRLHFFEDLFLMLDEIVAKRVGSSLKDYRLDIQDELWLISEKAVDKGHADKIVQVVCDETLVGESTQVITGLFGKVEMRVSKCPLVMGPLGAAPVSENYDKSFPHISELWLP